MAVLFVPSFVFRDEIYHFVSAPLTTFLPGGNMAAIDVASPFVMPLKLAAFTAFIAAMPYLLHQLWGFVAPGLYLREKKFALPFLASSILLFYAGMTFAYFVLFPVAFAFFANVALEGVTLMTDINRYLDFVLKIFFAFGVGVRDPGRNVPAGAIRSGDGRWHRAQAPLCHRRLLLCRHAADAAGSGHPDPVGHPCLAAVRGRHPAGAPHGTAIKR